MKITELSRKSHMILDSKASTSNNRVCFNSITLALFTFFSTWAYSTETSIVTEAPQDMAKTSTEGEVSFDPIFFDPNNDVNLSRYSKGNPVNPGTYRLEVILNQNSVGQFDIKFELPVDEKVQAIPCLYDGFLNNIGVSTHKDGPTAEEQSEKSVEQVCIPLETRLPGASYKYIAEEQRIELSIPQIYTQNRPRGWIDPSQWDSGITAGMLDYNINTFSSKLGEFAAHSVYGGFQSGLNVCGWRLRHHSNLNWNRSDTNSSSYDYNTSATYLEHDITALNAQIRLGNVNTQGFLFQGFSFDGVTLYSDDRMLPDSLSGYAPTIRGTADGNAKITVLQNNQIIYQTTVASGPFEISDLFPASYSGDLIVKIEEGSGTVRTITVPYSSTPQLLRPGRQRFSVTAGEYDDSRLRNKPVVGELTYQQGLTNSVTGYAGLQGAEAYQAVLIGSAFNTGIGALSLELTHSRAHFSDDTNRIGNSYRAAFSRQFNETLTNITLAAYRYSTAGYLGLSEAMQIDDLINQQFPASLVQLQKTRLEATINQTLPLDLGNIYVTGTTQQFWNAAKQSSYVVGYNTSLRGVTFGVSYQNSRIYSTDSTINPNNINNESYIQASVSIPFGSAGRTNSININHTRSGQGRLNSQVGMSGALGERNDLSYFVSASRSSGENIKSSNSINLGGSYRTNYGDLRLTSSIANDYKQLSLGTSGGMVVYSGGVKFGRQLGTTFAIIEAPGAEGARVADSTVIGADGLALTSSLVPYRLNSITLDPNNLPMNVQVDSTVQAFAPRAGSVSLIKYNTTVGRSLVLDIEDDRVPFGAELFDDSNHPVGVVGQGSRAILLLKQQVDAEKQDNIALMVKWGDKPSEQCILSYKITQQINQAGEDIDLAQATCIKPSGV